MLLGVSSSHDLCFILITYSSVVNVILVVGQEKLSAEMKKHYSKQLTVIKVPKSGGVSFSGYPDLVRRDINVTKVVDLDNSFHERLHSHQIRTYMYGTNLHPPPGIPTDSISVAGEPNNDLILSPASTTVNLHELSIFRIGTGEHQIYPFYPSTVHLMSMVVPSYGGLNINIETMAPASALPIGAKRIVSEMQPISVDASLPGSGLLNRVLAIMAPFNPDESERYDEEILDLTVKGFVVV